MPQRSGPLNSSPTQDAGEQIAEAMKDPSISAPPFVPEFVFEIEEEEDDSSSTEGDFSEDDTVKSSGHAGSLKSHDIDHIDTTERARKIPRLNGYKDAGSFDAEHAQTVDRHWQEDPRTDGVPTSQRHENGGESRRTSVRSMLSSTESELDFLVYPGRDSPKQRKHLRESSIEPLEMDIEMAQPEEYEEYDEDMKCEEHDEDMGFGLFDDYDPPEPFRDLPENERTAGTGDLNEDECVDEDEEHNDNDQLSPNLPEDGATAEDGRHTASSAIHSDSFQNQDTIDERDAAVASPIPVEANQSQTELSQASAGLSETDQFEKPDEDDIWPAVEKRKLSKKEKKKNKRKLEMASPPPWCSDEANALGVTDPPFIASNDHPATSAVYQPARDSSVQHLVVPAGDQADEKPSSMASTPFDTDDWSEITVSKKQRKKKEKQSIAEEPTLSTDIMHMSDPPASAPSNLQEEESAQETSRHPSMPEDQRPTQSSDRSWPGRESFNGNLDHTHITDADLQCIRQSLEFTAPSAMTEETGRTTVHVRGETDQQNAPGEKTQASTLSIGTDEMIELCEFLDRKEPLTAEELEQVRRELEELRPEIGSPKTAPKTSGTPADMQITRREAPDSWALRDVRNQDFSVEERRDWASSNLDGPKSELVPDEAVDERMHPYKENERLETPRTSETSPGDVILWSYCKDSPTSQDAHGPDHPMEEIMDTEEDTFAREQARVEALISRMNRKRLEPQKPEREYLLKRKLVQSLDAASAAPSDDTSVSQSRHRRDAEHTTPSRTVRLSRRFASSSSPEDSEEDAQARTNHHRSRASTSSRGRAITVIRYRPQAEEVHEGNESVIHSYPFDSGQTEASHSQRRQLQPSDFFTSWGNLRTSRSASSGDSGIDEREQEEVHARNKAAMLLQQQHIAAAEASCSQGSQLQGSESTMSSQDDRVFPIRSVVCTPPDHDDRDERREEAVRAANKSVTPSYPFNSGQTEASHTQVSFPEEGLSERLSNKSTALEAESPRGSGLDSFRRTPENEAAFRLWQARRAANSLKPSPASWATAAAAGTSSQYAMPTANLPGMAVKAEVVRPRTPPRSELEPTIDSVTNIEAGDPNGARSYLSLRCSTIQTVAPGLALLVWHSNFHPGTGRRFTNAQIVCKLAGGTAVPLSSSSTSSSLHRTSTTTTTNTTSSSSSGFSSSGSTQVPSLVSSSLSAAAIVNHAPRKAYGGASKSHEQTSWGIDLPLQLGPGAIASVGITPKMSRSQGRVVEHTFTITGSARGVPRANTAVWTVEENGSSQRGIPSEIQFATLVRHDGPFACDVDVQAKVSGWFGRKLKTCTRTTKKKSSKKAGAGPNGVADANEKSLDDGLQLIDPGRFRGLLKEYELGVDDPVKSCHDLLSRWTGEVAGALLEFQQSVVMA